jgi:16S rRNA (cytosine1402-N4)-methyltransferase
MSLKLEKYKHEPVLIKTVENYLNLQNGDIAIDCTLGLGGHSKLFLKKIGKNGLLIAFEQDENNLKIAKERLSKNKNKIIFIHKNFVHLKEEIEKRGLKGKIKLIFFDLGLASTHVDEAKRGFSFLKEGPLDMRFDKRNPITAEKILERYSEKHLEEIFKKYGEERYSKKFAKLIKNNLPIHTTKQLANLIEKNTPQGRRKYKTKHPATRIFQALRIEVNNELEILESALKQSIDILKKQGRLIVISYHSLEDRIVKKIIKKAAKECICPPEIPICTCNHKPELKIITKKPITPTSEEIEKNPRSRSAKLRIAEKI